jgi:hypothetical protein
MSSSSPTAAPPLTGRVAKPTSYRHGGQQEMFAEMPASARLPLHRAKELLASASKPTASPVIREGSLAAAALRRNRQRTQADELQPTYFVQPRPPSPSIVVVPTEVIPALKAAKAAHDAAKKAQSNAMLLLATGAKPGDPALKSPPRDPLVGATGKSVLDASFSGQDFPSLPTAGGAGAERGVNPVAVRDKMPALMKFTRWQQDRQRRRGGRGGVGGGDGNDDGEGGEGASPAAKTFRGAQRKYELVPPSEQWIPGLNTMFMEKVFSRDMWHHISNSDLRVNFCRCGGSSKDETFSAIRHRPTFMRVAEPTNDAEATEEGGTSPTRRAPANPAALMSRTGATARGGGGNVDRETLLFRLTDVHTDTTGSEATAAQGGARNRSPGARHHSTLPDPIVEHVSLLDIRGEVLVKGGARTTRVRPRLTDEQLQIAKAIGAANSEFRRMVEYRKQDTQTRYAHARDVHLSQLKPDGCEQHPQFRRQLQDEGKSLYVNGSEEVERWTDDRERMFTTKYNTIDISRTEPTWQRAMGRIRGAVASKLETEFSQERFRLQQQFTDAFNRKYMAEFATNLSQEAHRLLRDITEALSRGEPFGPPQVLKIVKTIAADSYFLDDVTSLVYSLAMSLDIPDQYWLAVIRKQTHFLNMHKEMVRPDDDPLSARWVLKIRAAELGPHAFLFATTAPACRSLSAEERASVINAYPRRRLAAAVVAIRMTDGVCEELRAAVAQLVKSGHVKVAPNDAAGPAAPTTPQSRGMTSQSSDSSTAGPVTLSADDYQLFLANAAKIAAAGN